MGTNRRLVYSGERFRDFLAANHITYQEASNVLGIDKNTIGKAVRGGNLNTAILLKICNEYKLDLSDFFITVDDELPSGVNYGEEYSEQESPVSDDAGYAAEDEEYYGAKISDKVLKELLHSKELEISRLRMLVKLYQERVDMLQQQLMNDSRE